MCAEPAALFAALWQFPAVDLYLRTHRGALPLGRTWSTEVRGCRAHALRARPARPDVRSRLGGR